MREISLFENPNYGETITLNDLHTPVTDLEKYAHIYGMPRPVSGDVIGLMRRSDVLTVRHTLDTRAIHRRKI